MINATFQDKRIVVNILTNSFSDNKSVNYVVKQDEQRLDRIRKLMEYSFEICMLFGAVYLSKNKKGCALILFPDKKKTTLKSIALDAKLAFSCIGISNIKKALKREAKINASHPKHPFSYLWFIGVEPGDQNKGIGSLLLNEVLTECDIKQRPIYLETSVFKNIAWYEKFGFCVYDKFNFDYTLYFLKKE
jgi:ribosomal protein S18 acetylase RimI-like enzyme